MRSAVAVSLFVLAGCTSVNTARLPQGQGRGDLYVTTGDVKEPYTSLGILQATRRGAVVFGFIDPAGTDLQRGLEDLIPEARAMGGDAIINLRFEQTQYNPIARTLGLLFFFVPLPTEVTVRGEVIRLGDPTRNRRRSDPAQSGPLGPVRL